MVFKMKTLQRSQRGAALITALVCLILVSLMGVISMRTSGINAKVSANAKLAAQTVHLATSAINQFFIIPDQILNLRTSYGQVATFPVSVIGNANVNIQAEYTGDLTCPLEIGVALNSQPCIFYRVSSNYQNQSGGESTVTAGFWSKVNRNED